MEIKTEITINATPEKIWSVLTDFACYPDWNPFVKSLTGNVAVGSKIKITLPGMKFSPTVLVLEKNREFRWLGHLLFPGLFDGEHRFQIVDNGDGTSKLIHAEKFRGILVGIFARKLKGETKRGFEEMNLQLKIRAEQPD